MSRRLTSRPSPRRSQLRLERLEARETPAGAPVLLKDINPPTFFDSNPQAGITWNDRWYFTATDPDHGRELWRTDGTPAGTTLVADINPGAGSSDPGQFATMNGYLYFAATNPYEGGRELWRTDGSAAGTKLVAEINT